MALKKHYNYTDSGRLILDGEVTIVLHNGSSSMGHMVAGIGGNETKPANVIIFDAGYHHATSVQIAIFEYADMQEELKKVFTAFFQYLSPSGGISARFDCDIRDLKEIKTKEGLIGLDEIPIINKRGKRS